MPDFYLLGDQPMTCPNCGARTEWVDLDPRPYGEKLVQQHTCRNCGKVFLACDDEDSCSLQGIE